MHFSIGFLILLCCFYVKEIEGQRTKCGDCFCIKDKLVMICSGSRIRSLKMISRKTSFWIRKIKLLSLQKTNVFDIRITNEWPSLKTIFLKNNTFISCEDINYLKRINNMNIKGPDTKKCETDLSEINTTLSVSVSTHQVVTTNSKENFENGSEMTHFIETFTKMISETTPIKGTDPISIFTKENGSEMTSFIKTASKMNSETTPIKGTDPISTFTKENGSEMTMTSFIGTASKMNSETAPIKGTDPTPTFTKENGSEMTSFIETASKMNSETAPIKGTDPITASKFTKENGSEMTTFVETATTLTVNQNSTLNSTVLIDTETNSPRTTFIEPGSTLTVDQLSTSINQNSITSTFKTTTSPITLTLQAKTTPKSSPTDQFSNHTEMQNETTAVMPGKTPIPPAIKITLGILSFAFFGIIWSIFIWFCVKKCHASQLRASRHARFDSFENPAYEMISNFVFEDESNI